MDHLPSRQVGRGVGLILLIFFCGLATGYLGFSLVQATREARGPEFRVDATLNELAGQLDLNPSQMEQIRIILDDAIMEEVELLSELRLNQAAARERISQYLTPEQDQEFNKMLEINVASQ